jgi:hypothetical protein
MNHGNRWLASRAPAPFGHHEFARLLKVRAARSNQSKAGSRERSRQVQLQLCGCRKTGTPQVLN